MNSGSNYPAGNGGRGHKRRHGYRGSQGAASVTTVTPSQEGTAESTSAAEGSSAATPSVTTKPMKRKQFKPRPRREVSVANGNRPRSFSSAVNQRTPEASVYSAPMDHSYRNLPQNANNGRAGYDAMPVVENLSPRPLLAFIDDLFFIAKVQETARKLNVKVQFVKSEKEAVEVATASGEKPALIIVDLNSHNIRPLTVISKLKTKFKKETSIIGFLSHLQGELKVKAQEAGCDMVLPRSAFSQNLPQLLRRHATSEVELQEC